MSVPFKFTQDEVVALSARPLLAEEDAEAFFNPPSEIQERFVGASFENAYRAASQFLNYLFAKIPAEVDGIRILDFGCGWGRMLRLIRWKSELDTVELHGCDLVPKMLDLCRRSIPRTIFTPTELYPPSAYRSDFFDVVYANSVFSHLSETNHVAWAQEFARIIKPGGRAVVTTQARHFIDFVDDLRTGKRETSSVWFQNLTKGFTDPRCHERYDAGEFLYAPHPVNANPEIYGDAIVPKAFFEEHWGGAGFEIEDWFEHPDVLGQNRVVLKKRSR